MFDKAYEISLDLLDDNIRIMSERLEFARNVISGCRGDTLPFDVRASALKTCFVDIDESCKSLTNGMHIIGDLLERGTSKSRVMSAAIVLFSKFKKK
jgi:hypothetical protein